MNINDEDLSRQGQINVCVKCVRWHTETHAVTCAVVLHITPILLSEQKDAI